MRIIIVNKFYYAKGGSETYCFALADALKRGGHEVHFFSMKDSRNISCDDEKYFVSHREYNGNLKIYEQASAAVNLLWSREAKKKFNALCQQVQPDIIHLNLVHRQITLSILDSPYVKKHHVPIVYTAHEYITICPNYTLLDGRGNICEDCLNGNRFWCIKKRCVKGSFAKSVLAAAEAAFIDFKQYYERFDCTIAPSSFLARKLLEGNYPSKRVVTLRNFLPDSVRKQINTIKDYRTNDTYLLYFGRLSREKGVDVLLRAYAEYINSSRNPMQLTIAGTGEEGCALKELTDELKVSNFVKFVGFKSGIELLRLIKGAKCTVMPSIWYENMPYSAIESLACGTPVLGSKIGGIPELAVDGRTGITFNPGDIGGLCKAMGRIEKMSDDLIRVYEKNCVSFVEQNLNESRYVDTLIDIYNNLIESRTRNE